MFLITQKRADSPAAALVDGTTGRAYSYRDISKEIARLADDLRLGTKGVVLMLAQNTISSIAMYLAGLHSGHAVLPVDGDIGPTFLRRLVEDFSPELVVVPDGHSAATDLMRQMGYTERSCGASSLAVWDRIAALEGSVHEDVTLLLATSGSTGNPKLVRLSKQNVLSNASSISEALDIGPSERAVTSLPPFYSYGLSVIHSHLLAGASVVVTTETIMQRGFWDTFRRNECTSCAAVPYMFEMFSRIGFDRLELPSLRTLTQAGGKLPDPLIERYHEMMTSRGGRLMVMYGQTEATARIACLPAHLLSTKLGSVGLPMTGGQIAIESEDGADPLPNTSGEVVYSGPNVMLGYATERKDLARGDEMRGVLRTGDLGYVDSDGCLFIVGRRRRFTKVFGKRVNLDDVEAQLQVTDHVAVLDGGDEVVVCCLPAAENTVRESIRELAHKMRVHPRAFVLHTVEAVPLLPNGKVDYRGLATLVGSVPPPSPDGIT